MKRRLLLAASAVLLVLAHPVAIHDRAFLDGGLLAWIALVPWWLAIRDASPRTAFRDTFFMATAFFLGLAHWLYVALNQFGGLSPLASLSGMILLAAWLALFPAAAAWSARRAGSPWLLPIAWAAAEWLRGVVLTGLPWGDLGHTQWRITPIAQLAELGGVNAIALLVACMNIALAESIATRRGRPLLALLALPPVIAFGLLRARVIDADAARRPTISVALAQGNITQDEKHDARFDAETRRRYNEQLRRAEARGADLAVWPEAALPAAVHVRSEVLPTNELFERNSIWLLAGAATWWDEGDVRLAHNSALLVGPGRQIVARYDKSHLVPFGEYVPLPRVLFWVRRLTQGGGDYREGATHDPLPFPKAKLGVLICYEDVFPDVSRAFVRDGAELLVNITNDAWYGHTSAAWQHAAIVTFRAIEERRAVVRSAQTGVSAVVDANGRIVDATEAFTGPLSLFATVPVGGPRSFYSRFGEWLPALCLGFAVARLASGRLVR